jgi:hypothetical protein
MNKEELSIVLEEHENWLHGNGGRFANLTDANLTDANLRGADLDFSCIPLWCGSLEAHFDDEQLKQIAYHLVFAGLKSKNASEETKKELRKLIDFANSASVIERHNLEKIKEVNE